MQYSKEHMLLLDEYDGDQILLDTSNSILFVRHSCQQEHEEWFYIKPKHGMVDLRLYLDSKITLLELMEVSSLRLAIRTYDDYELFMVSDIIPTEGHYTFPTDESWYSGVTVTIT